MKKFAQSFLFLLFLTGTILLSDATTSNFSTSLKKFEFDPLWNMNQVTLQDVNLESIVTTRKESIFSSFTSTLFSIFPFIPLVSKPIIIPSQKKYIRLIDHILTPKECQQLISLSEENGFEQAGINIGGKQQIVKEVRNNDRCLMDRPDIMEIVWKRIIAVCHDQELLFGRHLNFDLHSTPDKEVPIHAIGLNERMRFLRYDPGTYFAPHYDGSFSRQTKNENGGEGDEFSLITAQFYLNEGFLGGTTRFLNEENESRYVDVTPHTGSVLLFQHDLFHEGTALVEGRKYSLRTDVMFQRGGGGGGRGGEGEEEEGVGEL